MIKIRQFKFTKDGLLLVLCVVGTAAVAWWAWAAGPVESHSALGSTPQTETNQGLNASPYGSVSPAGTAGAAASPPSGNTSSPPSPPINVSPEPDPLYPIDPNPKCNYYKYPGSAQPSSLYCPICQPYQANDGMRYPCGCGGTELLCANPL